MSGPSVQDRIQAGLALHSQGKLDEAEQIYREVLRLDAGNFDALHLLGVLAYHHGRHEQAVDLISMAIRVNPNVPFAYSNRGNAFKALNRPGEALASYTRAAQLNPGDPEAHGTLGMMLEDMGRFGEALASYDRVIALKPDFVEAYLKRGNTLKSLKRPGDALVSYGKAIEIAPNFAEAHCNLGNTLKELGRLDEAVASFTAAIACQPGFAELYNNLGNVLYDLKRFDEARSNFDTAIRLKPGYAEAHYNRGLTLKALERFDEAIASFKSASEIKPDYLDAILNRCFVELLTANFSDAWKSFEGRIQREIAGIPRLTSLHEAAGKTVLVHWEQGLGDTIQFCRYASMLKEQGATVLFAPQANLKTLLGSFDGEIALVDDRNPPAFDFHIPLLSLPGLFGTVLETIPARHAYLSADPARIARWKEKIGPGGFKIGICWKGSAVHVENVFRSFPVDFFQQLGSAANVRLISLLKNEEMLPAGIEALEGLDAGPDAFVDTAAVMMNLDLVITADTSIAHLAGALGVPAWVALKHVPDWRWLTARADSPWYPTMRLFRQESDGDWQSVFRQMETALAQLRLSN